MLEVTSFEMLEGQSKLQKLNKERVDVLVVIIVCAKDRMEMKWKFSDEFHLSEKVENCSN